jgi:fatty acid desaturase
LIGDLREKENSFRKSTQDLDTVNNLVLFEARSYLDQHKLIWNTSAIAYTYLGYVLGIVSINLSNICLNLLGLILLSHSLVYSAYLSHEFMHGTIFKERHWNKIFGTAMLWLNGGCYYGFDALTLQHIAHHVNRVDVFTFDIPAAIRQQPHLIRQIIIILEWFYFPIVSFWSRWRSIFVLWQNGKHQKERARLISILLLRATLFVLLGLISLKAILFYFLSYVIMITILRWMDAFQHTYEAFSPGIPLPKRSNAEEQSNTYSNLLSRRYPWLNLLFLNFGYHNAHHALMKCPWHSLPKLDREISLVNNFNYIPFSKQLINYHRFRITRLLEGQGQTVDRQGSQTYDRFYGAADVSFLTLY